MKITQSTVFSAIIGWTLVDFTSARITSTSVGVVILALFGLYLSFKQEVG